MRRGIGISLATFLTSALIVGGGLFVNAQNRPRSVPVVLGATQGNTEFAGAHDWQTGYNSIPVAGNKTEFHQKWINYLGDDLKWHDIDTEVRQTATGFTMDKAPFVFVAPLRSTGEVEFRATNRWDVIGRRTINAAPVSSFVMAQGVADVEGVLYDMDGNGVADSVLYEGAYPDIKADLIYHVDEGNIPRLQKLIRFTSAPPKDFDASFAVRFSDALLVSIPDKTPPQKALDDVKGAITDAVRTEAKARQDGDTQKAEAAYMERLRDERDYGRALQKPFNGKTETDLSGSFSFRSSADPVRGIGWKTPYIWDSGIGDKKKQEALNVDIEQTATGFVVTKHVKTAFFDKVVFPVYADTTTTAYPDADTETTTSDGTASRCPNVCGVAVESWGTIRAGAGTTSQDSNATGSIVGMETAVAGFDTNTRGVMSFDLSSIPDGDTISAATLSLWGAAIPNTKNDTLGLTAAQAALHVTTSTPASNTAVASGDYAQTGLTSFGSIAYSSWSASEQYNDITLNATGLANLSKTGVTNLAFLWGADINNDAPTVVNSKIANYNINFAESAGTTTDPKIVVTHSSATGNGGNASKWMQMNMIF